MEDRIIEVLKIWGKPNCQFDGMWLGYGVLIDEVNEALEEKITMPQLKKQMKKLKDEGIVDYKPTYDDEGKICGKGYFLND